MNRKHDEISPPDCATPIGACGRAILDSPIPGNPGLASLAGADLAAEAAAFEAGRVSKKLAAGMLSLTNLNSDTMPRLLQRHSCT